MNILVSNDNATVTGCPILKDSLQMKWYQEQQPIIVHISIQQKKLEKDEIKGACSQLCTCAGYSTMTNYRHLDGGNFHP